MSGRTYKEIYGDKWEEQIQKRLRTKEKRGNYGGVRKHTEETKALLGEKARGRSMPDSHKEKRKKYMREKVKNGEVLPIATEEALKNMIAVHGRRVIQLTTKGEYITEYYTIREAYKAINKPIS